MVRALRRARRLEETVVVNEGKSMGTGSARRRGAGYSVIGLDQVAIARSVTRCMHSHDATKQSRGKDWIASLRSQ
jgi:hypothetical protein